MPWFEEHESIPLKHLRSKATDQPTDHDFNDKPQESLQGHYVFLVQARACQKEFMGRELQISEKVMSLFASWSGKLLAMFLCPTINIS